MVISGSSTKAAEKLGIAPTTLSRQISSLEEELGLALIEKNGRESVLTPLGETIFELVKEIQVNADKISITANSFSNETSGNVSISVSECYAYSILPTILLKLKKAQPQIQIELISTNSTSNLINRESDIALRNYRPSGDTLIAKKINNSKYSLFASHKFLEKNEIKEITDLNSLDFIGFNRHENTNVIQELNSYGLKISHDNFKHITNSHIIHWELVRAGLGIGFMADSIGNLEKEVKKVLPNQFDEMKYENWLVTNRDIKTNKKVRIVFDFLYKEFKKIL